MRIVFKKKNYTGCVSQETKWSCVFSMAELTTEKKKMIMRKAAGTDGVFQELFENLGDLVKQWLLDFYNEVLLNGDIPNYFKKIRNPRSPQIRKTNRKPIQL